MEYYMDILVPIIEEHLMLYAYYVEDTNYIEEFFPSHFLEFDVDYKEHIK
jgi:hypothetical protein